MAATKKPTTVETYRNIMSELKAGRFAPVYLLMGNESYYIDKICDWFTSNLLTEEEKDFNQTVLYGADTSTQQIMEAARRYPVMAAKRLVIVRDLQAIKSLDMLEKYMENPVASTVLVLCYMNGVIDARKKIVTQINHSGRVLVSESPRYDKDIIAFINICANRIITRP